MGKAIVEGPFFITRDRIADKRLTVVGEDDVVVVVCKGQYQLGSTLRAEIGEVPWTL